MMESRRRHHNRRLRRVLQVFHQQCLQEPSGRVGREATTDPEWNPSTQSPVPAAAIVLEQQEGVGLTRAQCEFFAREGFLVFPGLTPPDLCESCLLYTSPSPRD